MTASRKIYISFNRQKTKSSKRGSLGIITYFTIVDRNVINIPINLLQLIDVYTSEQLAKAITLTLTTYSITLLKLGYFVLNNASNNNTAIAALAYTFDFIPFYQRLRCGPYTLNLPSQIIIFSKDKGAYNYASGNLGNKEEFCKSSVRIGRLVY